MRLILSRKGFDSSAGKVASPILPDGTMFSLPIPSEHSPIRYRDITLAGRPLAPVVEALTGGRVTGDDGAHLDPDLAPAAFPRERGWRGLFGQAGTAQGMLHDEHVRAGDVFLFFGWFKPAEEAAGDYRIVKGSTSVHVLWGWLQIAEAWPLDAARSPAVPSWATYHPHVTGNEHMTRNTLYVASDRLVVDGVDLGVPGAGVFPRFHPKLQLTRPGATRSGWLLPSWFHPGSTRPPLGMHGDPARWTVTDHGAELQSVARGQEFVLQAEHYPEAKQWLADLVALAPRA